MYPLWLVKSNVLICWLASFWFLNIAQIFTQFFLFSQETVFAVFGHTQNPSLLCLSSQTLPSSRQEKDGSQVPRGGIQAVGRAELQGHCVTPTKMVSGGPRGRWLQEQSTRRPGTVWEQSVTEHLSSGPSGTGPPEPPQHPHRPFPALGLLSHLASSPRGVPARPWMGRRAPFGVLTLDTSLHPGRTLCLGRSPDSELGIGVLC